MFSGDRISYSEYERMMEEKDEKIAELENKIGALEAEKSDLEWKLYNIKKNLEE